MQKPVLDHDLLRSFGRVKGRVLRANSQALVETLLPKLKVSETALDVSDCFDQSYQAYHMEIGFGGGEHLAHMAKNYPNIGFIGCEPYINGIALLLKEIEKYDLKNIRIFRGDARVLLNQFKPESFEKLYVLFPDPWPKRKHHKKRLIGETMVALMVNSLKTGGYIQLATDHADYAGWMLRFMLEHNQLKWLADSKKDWQTPPKDWIETRYQQKAKKQGRDAVFFSFRKIDDER